MNNLLFKKPEINPVATCSSHVGLTVTKEVSNTSSVAHVHKDKEKMEPYQSSFSKKRKKQENEFDRRHNAKMVLLDKLRNTLAKKVTNDLPIMTVNFIDRTFF